MKQKGKKMKRNNLCFFLFCCLHYAVGFHIKFTKLNDEPVNNESDLFDHIFKGIRRMMEEPSIDTVRNEQNNRTNSEKPISTLLNGVQTKITELPDGGQKIEKLIEKESEFFKYPNHTIKKVDILNGKRNETVVECIDSSDCNTTSYCNKLSLACKTCHLQEETCTSTEECCPGYTCDISTKTCKKKKGMNGESCMASSDCTADNCCVLSYNGDGICQPYLTEGEDCSNDPFTSLLSNPFFNEAVTGLPSKCPCKFGLKCQKLSSFLFMSSERCLKPKPNTKSVIKIHVKHLPSLHYHNEEDEEMLDLPLLPGEVRAKRKNEMALYQHQRQKTYDEQEQDDVHNVHQKFRKRQHKRSVFPLIDIMSPFGDILDSMDDNDVYDDHDDEVNDKHPLAEMMPERKRSLKQQHRTKREFVEGVSEKAREAVHDAIDGIFDSIIKGAIEGMKYRE